MGGIPPVQDTLSVEEALELLRRRRQERGAVRTETESGRPPIGQVPQLTREQAESIFRRRRLRSMGFRAEGEGLIPPIGESRFAQPAGELPVAEPIFAQPPGPAVPGPLEPGPSEAAERLRDFGGPALPEPAGPVRPELLTPAEQSRREGEELLRRNRNRRESERSLTRMGIEERALMGDVDPRAIPALPGPKDFGAVLSDVAQSIRQQIAAVDVSLLPPRLGTPRPEGQVAPDRPVGTAFPAASTAISQPRSLTPGADAPRVPQASEAPPEIALMEAARQTITAQQRALVEKNIPSRVAFALGSGTARFAEAIINPLDPSQRNITNRLNAIQTGGGLVAPLNDRRNMLTRFGLGLAEMVPTIVGLQATGVLGAAGAVTAGVRQTIVAALTAKFGQRAAVRIFEEALKESAEEGLSVALFESVIGRGAGEDIQGRLTIFGEEVLSETGGFVLGGLFGAGRQLVRELAKLNTPLTNRIVDMGLQSEDQIPAILHQIALEDDTPIEQLLTQLSIETEQNPNVAASIIRQIRSAGAVPPISEIRRERRILGEQIEEAEGIAPIQDRAFDIAATRTVPAVRAVQILTEEFPRVPREQMVQIVAEAYGMARRQPQEVDVAGIPMGEEPARLRGRDPRARAEISSRLARLETRADAVMRNLEEPEAVAGDVPLAVLQEASDQLITDAAALGENALVDRAARLSARIREAVENPPERRKPEPEPTPEKAPEPEPAPEPAPAPEEPPIGPPPVPREPTPVRPVEPVPRTEELQGAIQRAEAEIAELEATPNRSRRQTDRLGALRKDLAGMRQELAREQAIAEAAPEPEPEPEPAPAPATPPEDRLPPAERISPSQRAEIESILPEARGLSDQELAEEMAALGIEAEFVPEEAVGRRVSDLSNDQLIARIEAAGLEVPAAGPNLRTRLLETVDPGFQRRDVARELSRGVGQERRELRGRLVGELGRAGPSRNDRRLERNRARREAFEAEREGAAPTPTPAAAPTPTPSAAPEPTPAAAPRPTPARRPAPEVTPPGERSGPTFESVPETFETVIDFAEPGDLDELIVERPDGSTVREQVRYMVIDIDEINESHILSGGRAVRNPNFVDELQPRETIDVEFIESRARAPFEDAQGRRQGLDAELLVLRTPTPERGPPIVDQFGMVFGGNNRVMMLRRAFEAEGPARDAYLAELKRRAEDLGIAVTDFADIGDPILVRVLQNRPADINSARALADDLNRTAVQARTPVEDAVLAAERISPATIGFFDQAFPADGTIRGFLTTAPGREFLRRLESDAVVSVQQRKAFFDREGALNDLGRDFIENVIFARALGSADTINRLSPSTRKQLLPAAPAIAATSGKFDLRSHVQAAVRLLEQKADSGTPIADLVGQVDLFGAQRASPFAAQIAHFLDTAKTLKEVKEGFNKFASSSRVAATEAAGQTTIGEGVQVLPAFRAAFGDDLLNVASELGEGLAQQALEFAGGGDREPTLARQALEFATGDREPTLPPREARPTRLQPTEEQKARLRERFGERTPEQIAAAQRKLTERVGRRAERKAQRGRPKDAPVQRRGGEQRGTQPPPRERIPPPGESGGGRTGKEPGDVNPPGEPGVARGQRKREDERQKTKDRQAAREEALIDEAKRFEESKATQDEVADIKTVRESIRGAIRAAAKEGGVDQSLVDDQLRDIARIQSNLLDVPIPPREGVGRQIPNQGFLVGNSPGTGKTFIGAAVVKEMIERGTAAGDPARVLVVIPGKGDGPIVGQWKETAAGVFDFQMSKYEPGESTAPGVYHISATALGNLWDKRRGEFKIDFPRLDLIVFDESHLFSNLAGANRARAAQSLRNNLPLNLKNKGNKVLHLSATPFEFPWDMGYMDNLRLWGPGRKIGTFKQWLASHGIRASSNSGQYYFVKSNRADVLRTLIEIRREMMDAGVYTQREMKVDEKLKNDFVEVPLGSTFGDYYTTVMAEIARLENRAVGVEHSLLKSAAVTFTRRISELAKMQEAVKLAKQFLALPNNFSVTIFAGYKMEFKLAERMAERFPTLDMAIRSLDAQMREGLQGMVRELGGEDLVAQVHGGISSTLKRNADITAFQRCQKRVLVATIDAGGTGLSLHDTSGKCPRVQINLTAPWTGKAAEQLAGRSYRFGTKSDVQMVWMGIDTPIERDLLQRVAAKMQALGALVQGKTETDATKLAEFDFLPAAEMQQHLFGYKKEQGINPSESALDFQGKANRQGPTESESMQRIEEARVQFEADMGASALPPNVVVHGKSPDNADMADDLELPRHNQKLLKPFNIIGKAARRLGVRTFLGGIKQPNVGGRFWITSEGVQLRNAQGVRTAVHEMAHWLDKMFFGFLNSPKDLAASIPTHLLPYVSELKPMAYAGAKDEVVEGFAEFVAEYVTNQADAAQRAPKFFQYFRDHMNRTSPTDLAVFDWMHDQFALFKKYRPAEAIGARVAVGDSGTFGDWKLYPGRRFQKWYTHWIDQQAPFRWMDQMMSLEDPDWRSLQMLARRVFGAEPLAENIMQRGWVSAKDLDAGIGGRRTSKSLREIFKKIDKRETFDLFRYWGVAMRARSLRSRGLQTGLEDLMDDGTVQKLLDQVTADPELSADFLEAWNDLQQYQEAGLNWLVETGVISDSQRQAMQKLNRDFLPYHRVMSEPDHLQDWVHDAKGSLSQGGANSFVGLPPGIHFFKGSTRPIVDPIESIIGNTRYFVQLGWRKQVENQLAQFSNRAFGAEGHARFIMQIDPKLVVSRVPLSQIKRALGLMGIEVDVPDEQLNELITLFSPKSQRKDLPVFSARIDGKLLWYQVNDPDTWNALAGLNRVEMGMVAKIANTAAGLLRTGVVISPEFMVRNFIRDAQTAWIQAPARGTGTMGAARSIPLVAAVEGFAEAIKAGPLWDEFVGSGAAGAALTQISRKTNQEYMRAILGRKAFSRVLSAEHNIPWNVQQIFRGVADSAKGFMYHLAHTGSLLENANRLSTFRALREEGANMLTAGFGARNVSTDFSVHGSRLAAWRLSTAFLNPAAQGTARTVRAFLPGQPEGNKPLMTLARSSMLTFASAALWWHNRNDDEFQEIPLAIRTRYWIFREPGTQTLVRIPKTYLYGDVFGSFLAEAFLDWAVDRDTDIVERLGETLRQGLSFSMVPTLALPAFEIKLNRSLHFGTRIESQSMENVPKEFRSNRFTTESARRLSRGIAKFAETLDASGMGRAGRFLNAANMSPVQWDHAVRGYFGTMGYDVWNYLPDLMRGGRNLTRMIRDLEPLPFPPNARTRNHFFIRGFTIQFPSASAESIRTFYEHRDMFNEFALRYEYLMSMAEGLDETDPQQAAQLSQEAITFRENHSDAITTAPLYNMVAASLAVYAKQRALATTAEEIDQINRQALNDARNALQLIGTLTPDEKAVLERREVERRFGRQFSRELDATRDQIDVLIMRRQLRGITSPPPEEGAQIDALINATPGLSGNDRATLRRYYRNNRRGSLVEQEADKTPNSIRRRLLREERNR